MAESLVYLIPKDWEVIYSTASFDFQKKSQFFTVDEEKIQQKQTKQGDKRRRKEKFQSNEIGQKSRQHLQEFLCEEP